MKNNPKTHRRCAPHLLSTVDAVKVKFPVRTHAIGPFDGEGKPTGTCTFEEGWLPITRLELLGKEMRMEVRAIVQRHDADGWEAYRAAKKNARSCVEKSTAYVVLVGCFLQRNARRNPELAVRIFDIARDHGPDFTAALKEYPKEEHYLVVAQQFVAAVYTVPGL